MLPLNKYKINSDIIQKYINKTYKNLNKNKINNKVQKYTLMH